MTDRIEKTIELRAPVERVWTAIADHREFGAWFRVKLDAPFAPGQEAQGQILYPGFEHVTWRARVVTMDEPRLFAFTWHPYGVDPDVDYTKEEPTLVEFKLEPIAGGTRLTIVESGFDKVPAHRREEAFRMNDGGWTQQIQNIKAHVGS
ncbi:MAG: SRPBCC family protein [Caulobacter sp.]|nr:SRPBCC family protein [Caulobacter sp.]